MTSGRYRIARFSPFFPCNPSSSDLATPFSLWLVHSSFSVTCRIRTGDWGELFPHWCSEHPVPRGVSALSGTLASLQAWGSPVLVLSSTAVQPLYSSLFQTCPRMQIWEGCCAHPDLDTGLSSTSCWWSPSPSSHCV